VARYVGLAGEVDRWARTLHDGSREVVWIMPPSARDLEHEVHQVVVRDLYRLLADELGSTVIDGSMAIGAAGDFVESILEGGTTVRVRSPDGLHLCPDGARRLAAAVAAVEPVVADALGSVVVAASGSVAAWTVDEAFSRAGCARPAPSVVRVLGVVEAPRDDGRSTRFFDRLR
jgi:hypothetical protein